MKSLLELLSHFRSGAVTEFPIFENSKGLRLICDHYRPADHEGGCMAQGEPGRFGLMNFDTAEIMWQHDTLDNPFLLSKDWELLMTIPKDQWERRERALIRSQESNTLELIKSGMNKLIALGLTSDELTAMGLPSKYLNKVKTDA